MNFVIDSNIVFSIIISGRKSKAYNIISKHDLELYFPEDGIEEFRKHKEKLSEYSDEFELRAFLTFALLRVIPRDLYEDKIPEAYELAKQFDEKDTPFIALALKLNALIWTGDKNMIIHSLRTRKYIALDTQAIEELIKGKSLEEVVKNLKKRYLSN